MKERVKQLCKEKGVSMNAAESEMGLAKGYISKLGNSNPNQKNSPKDVRVFWRICGVFDKWKGGRF